MAASIDTNNLTYFLNGEPIQGVYFVDTNKLTYFLNGEQMSGVFPASNSLKTGQFFLMF